MILRNRIIKDTAMLTIMQLILDTASLLLNVTITKRLGSSAMGIVSLTGSFMVLAGMVSNGNAFLCTSRLVSEERGKNNGNPDRVLRYAFMMCTALSISTALILFLFGEKISIKFFNTPDMTKPLYFIAMSLPVGAFSSCFKGYFNAMRKVSLTARADVMEFAIKSAVITILVFTLTNPSNSQVCELMTAGIVCGNLTSLIYFMIIFLKRKKQYSGKASINFRKYIRYAVPIMFGSCMTSALSSANDSLIPITLKQHGNSFTEAFSQFGIFEAIVIPALFFPSVILCSLSGIVVTESARENASGNKERIISITKKLIEGTLMFSIPVSAVMMRFGKEIGILMGGGELAGKMITIIAPVVPFIYLEIILEALIKGLGLQGFSSLNYIAEYAVRISSVLIFVPHFGFYGIVISYYASNVIGNTSRLIKILKHTGAGVNVFKYIFLPILCVFLTMESSELVMRTFRFYGTSLIQLIIFTVVWLAGYIFLIYGWNGQKRCA